MNAETPLSESTAESSRRKGNVARLPKKHRDLVNSMLDDGKTYPEIIAELEKSTEPVLPWPISPKNLSAWFEGGYKDYLRAQDWRERIDTRADRYIEIGSNDASPLVAGGLYAAT